RGSEIFHKLIYEERYTRIRELCSNPLLLAMVISIYRDSSFSGGDLASTRSSLYEKFMNKLAYHQKKKRASTKSERKIPEELNEELLSFVGYEMQVRELVYASEKDFQKWLAVNGDKLLSRWSNWWGDDIRPSSQDLYFSLIKSPQVKGVELARDETKRFSYLHQSFGEYYAALYIYEGLKQNEYDYQVLDSHITDKTRRQWEVVTFLAGLMDDVSPLLTYLKKKAQNTSSFPCFRIFVLS
ncbi:MAG: hypothetical protein KKF96_04645, partial [Proteobacteria bacterium]|nr:hypothetical protein [Pseudomonadota bacterium]